MEQTRDNYKQKLLKVLKKKKKEIVKGFGKSRSLESNQTKIKK